MGKLANAIKYNAMTQWLLKPWVARQISSKSGFIFTVSTGRSGTNTLANIFECGENLYAAHEDHPILNGELMVKYNQLNALPVNNEFFRRKLPKLLWRSRGKKFYFESNHMFVKSFEEAARSAFGDKLSIVYLERDPFLVAASMYQRGDIPDSPVGLKWYLDPRAERNLIKVEGVLDQVEFQDDFYKCLWYCFEIKARFLKLMKDYPGVSCFRLKTDSLNDVDKVKEMFDYFNISYDEARLKEVVGVKANASKRTPLAPDGVDKKTADKYMRACQEALKAYR